SAGHRFTVSFVEQRDIAAGSEHREGRMNEVRARTPDGLEIAAIDFGGSGDPIILLHGAGGNAVTLSDLASHLAPRHCVAVDLRGSGQSDRPPEYRWDDYLHDVDAVVEALGLKKPAVAGHSFGG